MTDEAAVEAGGTKIELTKGHLMDVASSALAVDLPCGYIDDRGVVHRDLVVVEMTGHEEDLLAAKGPVLPRLNQIIANCARRIGTIEDRVTLGQAVSQLTAADRMVAFLAIRRVSLGDFYDVKVQCPNPDCREEMRYALNLADVEIHAMEDPLQRVFTHTLKSGKVVQWHIMSSTDEEWLTTKTKKAKEDVLTLGLLARVDELDGVAIQRDKNQRDAMARMKALPTRDRNEIRSLFEKYEGHVDTNVDFSCPSCQHEWKAELNLGQPSFFFPSAS
jgi:hypothetical protein